VEWKNALGILVRAAVFARHVWAVAEAVEQVEALPAVFARFAFAGALGVDAVVAFGTAHAERATGLHLVLAAVVAEARSTVDQVIEGRVEVVVVTYLRAGEGVPFEAGLEALERFGAEAIGVVEAGLDGFAAVRIQALAARAVVGQKIPAGDGTSAAAAGVAACPSRAAGTAVFSARAASASAA